MPKISRAAEPATDDNTAAARPPETGAPAIPALLGLLVFAVALWAGRPYAVGVFHDDGVYAILAKALASGQGYRYLHLPGAPAATHYPIGYPFFLSVLWRISPRFPANVALLLRANAVLLALIAVATERFARGVLRWGRPASIVIALAATLAYPLILLSSLVLSETLFTAMLCGGLLLAEHVVRDGDEEGRLVGFAVLGVIAGLIILVRTHGAAFLLATLILLAYRRRWRATAAVALPALAVVAPWQIWAMRQPPLDAQLRGSYGSYVDWLAQGVRAEGVGLLARTVELNALRVGGLFADRFALVDASAVRVVTGVLCIVVLLAGARSLVRRAPVTVIFGALYVAVLLAWPYTPWRFLYAIWPLVIVGLAEAIRPAFARPASRGMTRWVAVGAAAGLVAGALREELRAYQLRTWRLPGNAATAQVAPMIRWAASNTAPRDMLAVEGEQLVYLFANRTAVPITAFTAEQYVRTPTVGETEASLAQLLQRFPVSYVLTVSRPVEAAADVLTERRLSPKPGLTSIGALSPTGEGEAYRVVRAVGN